MSLKKAQTETIRIVQNDIKMFTENFKNILFWVVYVAHEISYDCFFFNPKHKLLKSMLSLTFHHIVQLSTNDVSPLNQKKHDYLCFA